MIWLHGYSVAVIRSVFHGIYAPPVAKLRINLREGGWLVVATLVYGAPILLLFGAAVETINSISFLDSEGSYNYQSASVVLVTLLVAHFALKFSAHAVYDIGVARYANNDCRESLFEFNTNFSIFRKNARAFLQQELRQLLLLGLYGYLANLALSWMVVAVQVFTLGYLLYGYPSLHLFAQYATNIGIVGEPRIRTNENL